MMTSFIKRYAFDPRYLAPRIEEEEEEKEVYL